MNIAFLSSFSHDVHIGFADSINADVIDFRSTYDQIGKGTPLGDVIAGFQWPDYDIYIIEGSAPLYAAASKAALDDAKIIYLGGDRGMYALQRASGRTHRRSITDTLMELAGPSIAGKIGERTISGAIVVSDFIADYTRNIVGGDTPIRVAHPYIDGETFDELGTEEPDLSGPTAVTVGRAMDYKGIDGLVEAWPTVRETHPNAELKIVGPGGHPQKYETVPGVTVVGFVENLADAFRGASLFIQPSLGDAFAVSVVEAMRFGVPPLVTIATGARSEARAIDDQLVVDTDPGALAHGICRYFDLPLEDRQKLSARAQERGRRFDEASRKEAFRNQFESLVDTLD